MGLGLDSNLTLFRSQSWLWPYLLRSWPELGLTWAGVDDSTELCCVEFVFSASALSVVHIAAYFAQEPPFLDRKRSSKWHVWPEFIFDTLNFVCPVLLLEGQRPAKFSSNLFKHTCLKVSNRGPADLDGLVQVCLIIVGVKLCRTLALRKPDLYTSDTTIMDLFITKLHFSQIINQSPWRVVQCPHVQAFHSC